MAASPAPAASSQHHSRGSLGPAWLCLLLLLSASVPIASTNPSINPDISPGINPNISPGVNPGINPNISPGITARLTRRALEFGRRFGMELLQSLLQKEHELDLEGSYDIPLLGTLTYTVPRIHIQELQVNDSSLDFAEDVGLRLMVLGARIRLSAEWGARLGAVQDSGSLELQVQDLAVAAVLGLGADAGGRPALWSAGCDARSTHLSLEFHHGHSWLYNLLARPLRGTLQQELNKQLCIKLRKGVSKLEDALKQMRVFTPVDTFVAIDHSLLGPPAITAEHGDIAIKGEFFRVHKFQQRPSLALPMALPVSLPVSLPVAHEPMLLVAVSDFVANSAAFAYFTAGALRRNISSAMLLRRFPVQLKTKSFGIFAPQLQERFPDQPMELQVWARRQPLFSCRPDALHGALFGSAEAFVLLPNGTRVPAFLLDIDANVTGKPIITGNRLGATISLKGLRVAQVTSHVGPVEVQRLETLLRLGLRLFGVPRANKWLQARVPLPIPHGLRLLNPRLSLQEGFMLITADLQDEL